MSGRGKLTDEIKCKWKEKMDEEIDTTGLRLLVHIQYVMTNSQKLEPSKLNGEERKIMAIWRKKGWIEGGASGMAITKQFWDAMCEVIWLGYVAYEAP